MKLNSNQPVQRTRVCLCGGSRTRLSSEDRWSGRLWRHRCVCESGGRKRRLFGLKRFSFVLMSASAAPQRGSSPDRTRVRGQRSGVSTGDKNLCAEWVWDSSDSSLLSWPRRQRHIKHETEVSQRVTQTHNALRKKNTQSKQHNK